MFELLAGPILAVAAVLGFVAVSDPHTVHIGTIVVPDEVEAAGYTPEVIEIELLDAMEDIERDARSFDKARRLSAEADPSSIRIISDQLGTTESVRAVQKITGHIGYSVEGDLVKNGDDLRMALRSVSAKGDRKTVVVAGTIGKVDELVTASALALMAVVDPYMRAAWQFREDHPKGDFAETKALIAGARVDGAGADLRWVANLAGIVAYLERMPEQAMAEFDAALALDSSFAPAVFNQGVVLAAQGKHREAIERFRTVLGLPATNDAEPVHAAAYSEWGVSLAAMGYAEGAIRSFEYAVQAHPAFADTYTNWAQVLRADGKEAEAAAVLKRRDALTPAPAMYTEFLVGAIGSDAFAVKPADGPPPDGTVPEAAPTRR